MPTSWDIGKRLSPLPDLVYSSSKHRINPTAQTRLFFPVEPLAMLVPEAEAAVLGNQAQSGGAGDGWSLAICLSI